MGRAHLVAVDEAGNIYTSGENSFGQLGRNEKTPFGAPQKINFQSKVKFVAAVQDLTYLVTEDNRVYVAGNCQDGLCMDIEDRAYVQFTTFNLILENIKSIKTFQNSVVIEAGNEFYALGKDEKGQFC